MGISQALPDGSSKLYLYIRGDPASILFHRNPSVLLLLYLAPG